MLFSCTLHASKDVALSTGVFELGKYLLRSDAKPVRLGELNDTFHYCGCHRVGGK
jgi:hypothetical protein